MHQTPGFMYSNLGSLIFVGHHESALVFQRLLKPEPRRLFLGTLSVASGSLVRNLEGLVGTPSPTLDRALLAELSDLLALPKADTVDSPSASDIGVDVALQSYWSGSATDFSLGAVGLPLYWRPKVRLAAKLYGLQSKQLRDAFHVTRRMPWSIYLLRVLSWRVLLGLEHPARRSDLEFLLRQATESLLVRLRKSA